MQIRHVIVPNGET